MKFPAPLRPPGRLWHALSLAAFGIAGTLLITSGINANGADLRVSGITSLDAVARKEAARVTQLQQRISSLKTEIDELSIDLADEKVQLLTQELNTLREQAGFTEALGSGITVELDDAPKSVRAQAISDESVDINSLIVHQQDIQGVINALWAGGAEGISLQGQRVIATTGIKCVGNTVRLHGVTYAPPYRIQAIGDSGDLLQSLIDSDEVSAYRDYVNKYQLGWSLEKEDLVSLPAYGGSVDLQLAEAEQPQRDPADEQSREKEITESAEGS